MLIEIHLIQSFSPSNLNRDDTGNPKDAMFGGERRVRISSQAQKRPVRMAFRQSLDADIAGVRSQWVNQEIAERLQKAFPKQDIKDLLHLVEQFWKADLKEKKAKKKQTAENNPQSEENDEVAQQKSDVLIFTTPGEIDDITSLLQEFIASGADIGTATRASLKPYLSRLKSAYGQHTSAPDIAMFGRMLADVPALNMDAACQVAHAISTHQAVTEFDYFTAVDDLQPEDTSGAGMIGLTPFTSATFYRYARVDWEQLVRNLGGDAALALRTVDGFLRALVFALPTGKQNTFASHHTPDFLLAVVRPDSQGWSLANAFEKSVRAHRGSGYVEPSIERLIQHWRNQENIFRLKLPRAIAVLNPAGVSLEGFSRDDEAKITTFAGTLPEWLTAVLRPLPEGG